MQAWQEKLVMERDEAIKRREQLKKRLREPQADVSDFQWDTMHRELHAMNKYVSCLIARVEEFEND